MLDIDILVYGTSHLSFFKEKFIEYGQSIIDQCCRFMTYKFYK